jgi:predicted RNA polymerase sigma factor
VPEAQVALTLRTLCGLQTDEIARAFLVPVTTMGQRLVRAKRKIRDAGVPYVLPEVRDMAARLDAVLTVIYLIFNEPLRSSRARAAFARRVAEPRRGSGDGRRAPVRAALIDELVASNDLENYDLLYAARADLLHRLGFSAEPAKSYQRALALVTNDSERRFLEKGCAKCSFRRIPSDECGSVTFEEVVFPPPAHPDKLSTSDAKCDLYHKM